MSLVPRAPANIGPSSPAFPSGQSPGRHMTQPSPRVSPCPPVAPQVDPKHQSPIVITTTVSNCLNLHTNWVRCTCLRSRLKHRVRLPNGVVSPPAYGKNRAVGRAWPSAATGLVDHRDDRSSGGGLPWRRFSLDRGTPSGRVP